MRRTALGGRTTYWATSRAKLCYCEGTAPCGTLVTRPLGDGRKHAATNRLTASVLRVWRRLGSRGHGHLRRSRAEGKDARGSQRAPWASYPPLVASRCRCGG
jgi:hypothetical protein